MTAKRFMIDKNGGVFYLFDNGNLIPISDGQPICDLLNELHEENQHIKHTIKTMMENERTELGQSVLKQLWEQIE